MNTNLFISYGLWFLTLAVQTGICVAMIKKRLFHEMPLFLAYTSFHVLRSLALLGVRQWASPTSYSYTYWVSEAISVLLGFAVIYELFSVVLQRFQGLRQLGMMLFRWAFVVLVMIAIVSANRNDASSPGLITAVLVLERSVRIIQCGLVVFLFMFASTLALSWRHYVFGVALGFGLYAAVELILTSVRVQVGASADQTYIFLKPAAYAFSTLIWMSYLLNPISQPVPVRARFNNQVEEWNEAILSLLSR